MSRKPIEVSHKGPIGYEIHHVGPGGKTTLAKREGMPGKVNFNVPEHHGHADIQRDMKEKP